MTLGGAQAPASPFLGAGKSVIVLPNPPAFSGANASVYSTDVRKPLHEEFFKMSLISIKLNLDISSIFHLRFFKLKNT